MTTEELDPLELELQRVMSCPMWVLNIKLAFSGRTVCALKCQAISPDLLIINGLEGHKSAVKVTQHIDMAVRDMLFPEITERQDTFWALER